MDVTIKWWTGTYSTNWSQWKTNGGLNFETVPQNAIIMTTTHESTTYTQK